MLLERLADGIEPVRGADIKLEISRGLHLFHPERDDDRVGTGRALDFANHLARFVGFARQDEDEDRALVDRIQNGGTVIFARGDIARRHPAANPVGLQKPADLFRDRFIYRRMTDEDGAFHQCELALLFANKNTNASDEGQNAHDHRWNNESSQRHNPDEDQINREQQHSDVFGEVHDASILIVRPSYNLKLVLKEF